MQIGYAAEGRQATTGGLIVMLVLASLAAVWAIAIIASLGGYRDALANRAAKQSDRYSLGTTGPPNPNAVNIMLICTAIVLLLFALLFVTVVLARLM